MNDYMMGNNGGFGQAGGGQEMQEIKSLIKTGNVLRAITIGSVIVIGGVIAAMQIKNGSDISNLAQDVRNTRVDIEDINKKVDDIAADVYDIMEQGCTQTTTTSPYSIYFDPGMTEDKPVIYLYPETSGTQAQVKLTLSRTEMLTTWPMPDETDADTYIWNVTADPDGTVYDKNGNEYSYIFWEGTDHGIHDLDEGFCVAGEDTAQFLRDTLKEIGLNSKEANEFIVYWLPRMQDNEYNLIKFEGLDKNDIYNTYCKLEVTDENGAPADSMLRIMMVWKGVDSYTDIEPQSFNGFARDGFTVVEWGGTEITE